MNQQKKLMCGKNVVCFYLPAISIAILLEKFGLFNYHWIMYLSSICAFVVFLMDILKHRFVMGKYQKALWTMMGVLLVSTVASGVFFTYLGAAVYESVLLLTLFMFVTVFYAYASEVSDGEWRRTMLKLSKVLVVFFAIVDLVSVVLFLSGNYFIDLNMLGRRTEVSVALEVDSIYNFEIGGEKTYRFIGLFSDPNTAGFLNISVICLALFGLENKEIQKPLGIIGIALAFFVIVLSKSRNAMLSMLPVGILALARAVRKSEKLSSLFASKAFRKKIWLVIGLGIVCGCFFVIRRVLAKTNGYSSEELYALLNLFTGARMTVWSRAVMEGLQKPWFGYGYYIEMPFWKIVPLAHNLFINLFNFGGLFALAFGGYAVFGILGRALKNFPAFEKRGYGWLVVLLFSVFLMSMLDNCIIARVEIETALFWLIAGLVSVDTCKR